MSQYSLVYLVRISSIFMNLLFLSGAIFIERRFFCSLFDIDYRAENLTLNQALYVICSFLKILEVHLSCLPLVSLSLNHSLFPGDEYFSDERCMGFVDFILVSLKPEFSLYNIGLSILILTHNLRAKGESQVEITILFIQLVGKLSHWRLFCNGAFISVDLHFHHNQRHSLSRDSCQVLVLVKFYDYFTFHLFHRHLSFLD